MGTGDDRDPVAPEFGCRFCIEFPFPGFYKPDNMSDYHKVKV